MRQRVMIAMAIANDPDVIIADEPTTALDVTIQAQVLDVLKLAQKETGAAVIMITHDLGVVAGIADRVQVMYAGRSVETGTVDDVYYRPRMPYTIGLLGSVPRLDEAEKRALGADRGQPAVAVEPAAGLQVRAPLPDGDRRVQRRRTGAARGRHAGSPRRVHPQRRDRRRLARLPRHLPAPRARRAAGRQAADGSSAPRCCASTGSSRSSR